MLHEHVVIISAQTANAPHIPWEQRLTVDHLGDPRNGIVHIAANFGFQDRSDIPDALRRASAESLEGDIDPDSASYLSTLRRTHQPGMSTWRKRLFVALAHNAANQTDYLCLPDARRHHQLPRRPLNRPLPASRLLRLKKQPPDCRNHGCVINNRRTVQDP